MLQELKFQVSTAVLTVITVAAIVAAVLNFDQLHKFHLADDGATWNDDHGSVVAYRVSEGGGAWKAGIREGDVLIKINNGMIKTAVDVPQIDSPDGDEGALSVQVRNDLLFALQGGDGGASPTLATGRSLHA